MITLSVGTGTAALTSADRDNITREENQWLQSTTSISGPSQCTINATDNVMNIHVGLVNGEAVNIEKGWAYAVSLAVADYVAVVADYPNIGNLEISYGLNYTPYWYCDRSWVTGSEDTDQQSELTKKVDTSYTAAYINATGN
jgi:hypothetical protein